MLAPLGLAAALALSGCGGTSPLESDAFVGSAHPFPTRVETKSAQAHAVHGIDISKYQKDIDWAALKGSGVGFVFIKATEGGDRKDDLFESHWAEAKAAGVPRGAYHFSYWCRPMAEQVEWFKRHVPRDPDALPPVLDVEWNFHSPTCPKRFPKEVALREMRTFLKEAERYYGKRPIIYADISFYRDVLADGDLSEYPFWVRSVKAVPHERYGGREWAFWQYTAKGRVPGINGDVDRNVFAGSREQWTTLVAGNFHPPKGGAATAVASTPPPASASAFASTAAATSQASAETE